MAVSPPQQDPQSLIVCGNRGLPPQHNPPSDFPHASQDGYRQRPSPSPSGSAEIRMGYPGHEDLAPPSSPTNSVVGNRDVTDSTLMNSCVCGCSGGACIPQREYERQRTHPLSPHDLQETIVFSVNGKCGYPPVDALRKQYRGLDGRDDKMFVNFKSSISLRLEWLPYRKWTRQIRTLTWRKDQDYIDRAKLATEVAKRMKFFFEEMQGKAPDPSHMEYRVQPGIIDVDHLELVALKRVSKSSWMPHFRLITPPRPA